MPVEGLTDIELLAEIGRGQFGLVHRATMQPHGLVAAKEIDCAVMAKRLGTADWAILRDHLFAEAETLRKAAHAHVVSVFSVHYDGPKKHVYIITELCDGGLHAVIKNGPLPLTLVRKYVRHALLGLEALHGRGMIHRDLKPANILTIGSTAKLSDFGLVTDKLVAGYASQQGYLEQSRARGYQQPAYVHQVGRVGYGSNGLSTLERRALVRGRSGRARNRLD